jgi:hypothetical protein
MKLSEAMRDGILYAPRQALGIYVNDGAACALGAVMIGSGIASHWAVNILTLQIARMRKMFPELEEVTVKKPPHMAEIYGEDDTPGRIQLESAIYFLNDILHASREDIADWLEEIGY